MNQNYKDISELKGLTIIQIENNDEDVVIETAEGRRFHMSHFQDCCEYVRVDEIEGSVEDILNKPITVAIEDISEDLTASESGTLTHYTLGCADGSQITIKWKGSSNGYYSESVYFVEL